MTGPASEFPPHILRQYALLADGERGVLVGPHGEFAWMCAPRWHSDAVFSALIGGRGSYTVRPDDLWFVWGGYYERGSLIWRNRWVTSHGVIECREALAYPGDRDRAVVLRRIEAVDRPVRARVMLDPRAGFGEHHAVWEERDGGYLIGRTGPLRLRWSGAPDAKTLPEGDGALGATIELDVGESHDLVLEIVDGELPDGPVDAATAWQETARGWEQALPDCRDTVAPREARHAYAVISGLTSKTGGMVAAATSSLPERAEEGRNYDYRYVWMRDQCWVGQAIAAHVTVSNRVAIE